MRQLVNNENDRWHSADATMRHISAQLDDSQAAASLPSDADEDYNKQHDQWTLGFIRVAGCDINKQAVQNFVLHLNAIAPATVTERQLYLKEDVLNLAGVPEASDDKYTSPLQRKVRLQNYIVTA